MNRSIRYLATGLAACLSFVFTAAAAGAQQPRPMPLPQVEAQAWQGESRAYFDAGFAHQPHLDQALRAHGLRADRLSRAQTRALEDAFAELFPDRHPRRYPLNRTQAQALVYIALVQPHERDGRGRQVHRPSCDSAGLLVYELGDVLGGGGRGRSAPLSRHELEELRDGAREVQHLARQCGNHRLADEAATLAQLTTQRRVDRAQIERQLDRMKPLVRSGLLTSRF